MTGRNAANPTEERRRLERFDLRLPAKIETLPQHPDQSPVVLNLTTKDISARGAFFPSVAPFDKGTRVKVDLILSPEKPKKLPVKRALIKVVGTVLRSGADGMAMNFERNYQLIPLH